MKTILATLVALTSLGASAQIVLINNTGTNADVLYIAWNKANSNFVWLASQVSPTNTASSNRTGLLSSNDWQTFNAKWTSGSPGNGGSLSNIPLGAIVGLGDAQTNSILRSGRFAAWTTNQFLTTNTVRRALPGTFTNIAGIGYTVLTGSTSPWWRYYGGDTNWIQAPLGNIVTTGIVEVSFYDQELANLGTPINPTITNITIYAMERPDLFGRTNQLVGQSAEVDAPSYGRQVANKDYVDQAVAGVNYIQNGGVYLVGSQLNLTAEWSWSGSTNGSRLTYLGADVMAFENPELEFATITSIKKTNNTVWVTVWTNGISGPPIPHWTYDLAHPTWAVLSSYTNAYPTVSGTNYQISFPLPHPTRAFIRVAKATTGVNVANLSALLSTPPRTVTNATDTTWGKGSGLLTWDTNYVYISVGSNLWKRAALSTW